MAATPQTGNRRARSALPRYGPFGGAISGQRHDRCLEKRLSGLEDEVGTVIRNTPLWRERHRLLRSLPGGWPGVVKHSARPSARVGKI